MTEATGFPEPDDTARKLTEALEEGAQRGDCDAHLYGGAATIDARTGACCCIVCARCGHHTGNSHQGHWWKACKVLAERVRAELAPGEQVSAAEWLRRTSRPDWHFCCPEPHGCEAEKAEPVIDMGYLSLPAELQEALEADAAIPSEPVMDLLEAAWGIIANAGWDGDGKTPGWQEAAERWRDRYHAVLAAFVAANRERATHPVHSTGSDDRDEGPVYEADPQPVDWDRLNRLRGTGAVEAPLADLSDEEADAFMAAVSGDRDDGMVTVSREDLRAVLEHSVGGALFAGAAWARLSAAAGEA